MESKFCIVMPIVKSSYLLRDEVKHPSNKHHNNFERFFRVGWSTLFEHIEWKNVATFFVIVRMDEKASFEKYMRKYIPQHLHPIFSVLAQEDLIHVGDMEKSRVQMLSKILIATRVPTSHYLILDDDVVALRKFGFRDIFSDRTHRYVRYTNDDMIHEPWARGSAEVLQLDYDSYVAPKLERLRKQKRIMSVTPEIFITKQALSLLNHLKHLHGEYQYQRTISSIPGRWTEYTLMWIYLMENGLLTKLYHKARIPLSDNKRNIWYVSPNLHQSLQKMWSDPKPYFGVIQSNVPEHEVETVVATIRMFQKV